MSTRAYFPDFSNSWDVIIQQLKGKRVAVIGHVRPDGDSIGSQTALCRILNHCGIEAKAICYDPIPQLMKVFVDDTPFHESAHTDLGEWDAAVAVDCSAHSRMSEAYLKLFPKIDWCIDHHLSNKGFAETNWIDPKAAATCEIIAGIALDNAIPLDPITAQALYVGIATDTGQFCYAATSERVMQICALLIAFGAQPHPIAHQLYECEPKGRTQLLAAFLSSLEFHIDDRLVFGKITQNMFASTGTTREQTEGFINHARNVDSCEIAALFEEQPDRTVKGSLRSKFPEFKVDRLAAQFGGGGHACAAGFHSSETLDTFPSTFLEVTREHLASL
jgi:phosphoesterase RecJ-like protein